MAIIFSDTTGEFHLFNDQISYIIQVLPNKQLGNLYYGKRIRHKKDFSYLVEGGLRSLAVYPTENEYFFSPQYTRMEYPCTGTGDYREPAFEVQQENGSRIVCLEYQSHRIYKGKPQLEGLPALYTNEEEEAETLEITLTDPLLQLDCILCYSIFRDYPVITRSTRFVNRGEGMVTLDRVLSSSIDLPDSNYDMIQLSGAWARERRVIRRHLEMGVQGINSRRGTSSAEQNPFLALVHPETDEFSGVAYGFSFVYSGNHMEQVEVDTCNMARVQIGIHPEGFEWPLLTGESFQSPEAVLVYSDAGLNGMSQVYHRIYRKHLIRSRWKEKERPILINNWEATGITFTEDEVLAIAKQGSELGMELFVLDDGWFGKRKDDKTGLGDWYVSDFKKLPDGIKGLAEKIEAMGMKFGLWIEPEMVNRDSDLFRLHPDWILCAPGRHPSLCRNQYILDFTRKEVVDYIYDMLEKLLSGAPISYVKWDMNRYMSECYSIEKPPREQGKVMHEYVLGVYRLYERLLERFPEMLFESCSSGGARFDPGMLYYSPQVWTSDDTDAMERVKIQYGSSYVYPLYTMGAHVSAVPNQQVGRITPLETRGNVAQFGVFGFELNLTELSEEEKMIIKGQVEFAKRHRKLIMEGDFYRLKSPFEENDAAWMVVSEDKSEALVGFYRMLGMPNEAWIRLRLAGLDKEKDYCINEQDTKWFGGDELMHVGMVIDKNQLCNQGGDYSSKIYYLKQRG